MVKPTYLKEVRVEDAIGMKLGHDLTQIVPGAFKGRVFQAGHVITEEDIPLLLDIGKRHIYIMDTPQGFLHENEAAERMARAFAGEHVYLTGPVEGKMTLKSAIHGLLKVDPTAVEQANQIEGISVSTLLSDRVVQADQSLAGIRPIPLIIEEEKVKRVEQLQSLPAIEVKPFQKKKVGIVTTGSEVFTGRIEDRFGPVLKDKLKAFGSKVLGQRFADDELDAIQAEIRYFVEQEKADLILVTGGMSVDPDDRTPGAIKAVGADIVRYGIPMLPGSMLLVAYLGEIPILGLPGCVIHDSFTSFDVFLPRVLVGEKITESDIISIGYGGFHT
ncbi:molybdopterin-binding protein [Ammoniphilus oxalaticus]|uniref:Molybdopterin molybdenumtransferase n=1 Tax=Ammoniphilus oxalaticus TaxID=66863 RepID=A0A419SFM8_9BACL|nr:molybdopterin-binding protein [Ammoniphilus oxalaticus]RKD22593.1 molybdopterin-binding protein [Ammoniphilus oxalaticus]